MTCLLYTLPCQGKLDRSRHAGSLPVRQYADERHDIVLEGVICRRRALELRGYLTEGVLVLARNRNDCISLSPDDAVPEDNLIPNLLKELGAQSIIGNEKE